MLFQLTTTERMKQRRIDVDLTKFVNPAIDKKKNPPQLPEANSIADNSPDFMIKYFIWLLLRKRNGMNQYNNGKNDQCIPTFAGN